MSARRLAVIVALLVCSLVGAIASYGAVSASAATQFGSRGAVAGEFQSPSGIAIDQQTGDLVVSDRYNYRIDKFGDSGEFLSAWGWGVNGESSVRNELQTCTTSCQVGESGTGAGEFRGEGPRGVAVDNDPLSSSYGDVYVVDWENFRVEKFDSSGNFLLMFGGEVNTTTKADVCTATEACGAGSPGTADGQFEWSYQGSYIAVGPGGNVYVGDKARVQIFEPLGIWKESIPLTSFSSEGEVRALTVDPEGDMFVKDEGAPGIREIEPSGTVKSVLFDAGSESVSAIALDDSGDLFVGDSGGGFHIAEYESDGKQLASFGSKTLTYSSGIAFGQAVKELYVAGYVENAVEDDKVWVFTVPPPGPLLEPGSESVTPALRGKATLEAIVNPEGNETTYRFEYVDQADYQSSGFAKASSTASATLVPEFEDEPAQGELTGLTPSVTYHYRIVATNAKGTATGPDQSFEATPSMYIDGPWTSNVTSTSVDLAARIDPLGASTEYRLEYGSTTGYGHVFTASVGEGMEFVPFSYHIQGLQPGTAYHYRIVAVNEVGTVEGVDHVFDTQPAAAEAGLPDGRAWELVSPADKKGAVIEPFEVIDAVIQASSQGDAITYPTEGPHVGEDPQSRPVESTVISRRSSTGWSSVDIDMPRRTVNEGESTFSLALGGQGEFALFSADLSLTTAEPTGNATPPLSAEATERTLYLRNNESGTYLPLVTPADVPPGTKFGGEESVAKTSRNSLVMRFNAATPDLRHVVFESPLALTDDAVNAVLAECENACGLQNLYEWSEGGIKLVNILPNGKPTHEKESAYVAGEAGLGTGLAARPLSSDGRWIAWTWGSPYGVGTEYRGLYVRDMLAGRTYQVGGPRARYQSMSSNGALLFYLEDGELYEYDTGTGTSNDLTTGHGAGEEGAGVQESVSDLSEDGSYVYFVAHGVLAAGGISGEDNLYLLHENSGKWVTSLVAVLSPEDEPSWSKAESSGAPNLAGVSSRVSPDGRYLAFMSNRSLTGYDNVDAVSQERDEEVYLYDSHKGSLACVSCNPTGARPTGILDAAEKTPLVDKSQFWGESSGGASTAYKRHWLAASIPGWTSRNSGQSLYQPRYLSDSGRLFFNSADALVPQDTNGLEDVYEYEPADVGGCAVALQSFDERSEGCVELISAGISSSESVFYDASESGDDVFFLTASRLTAADYDNSFDVYDAHVCSVSVPCQALPIAPPPCDSGDSCKAAPTPQPTLFGPAPSATFSGVGNVLEVPHTSAVKAKHKRKAHPKRKRRKRSIRKRSKARKSVRTASRKGANR